MRNLIFILFLGVFGFVVAGWFLDWYSIGGARTADGRRQVQINFDTKKIGADFHRGQEKLQDSWPWFDDEEAEPVRTAAPKG